MSALALFTWVLVVANLVALPLFIFLLIAAVAAICARREPLGPLSPSSRFLFVVPAHDEENGIVATVRSLRLSDYPRELFGVLVIADNCTDRTRALASEAGARVVERFDTERKSKGYALEYLIESLASSGELATLDALVIVDADTTVDPKLLLRFDQDLRAGSDWIQCYYTVANPDQSWRTRLLTYAFSLYNGVLPLGQYKLGSSAGFKGNGMCFSTRGLARQPWRAFGLVEDMEFSWILRLAGERIRFEREACVYAAMLGAGGTAAASQRQRWEFGRSEVRRKYLPQIVDSALIGWRDKLISACELLQPPMTLLGIAYCLLMFADWATLILLGADRLKVAGLVLFVCMATMTVALAEYAIAPFLTLRLPWRYTASIGFLPFYAAWRFLILLSGPPRQWVRTPREPATVEENPAAGQPDEADKA
jgi:cellulose synthase/poly-beta-1,6-N-acetylglucosamine synthase-like glycosyltransferase